VPAATTLGRFVVNTTFGLAGIFDFAGDVMHVQRVDADFGQTLHRYGVPRGPYLVVPIFGPSTARDAFGTVVDQALDPLTYIIGPLNLQWQLILGGGQGLATREANADAMDALREASVDFYSALRSAYLQSRRARELEVRPEPRREGAELGALPRPAEWPAQEDSVPAASLAMRSSMAAISASKPSRFTIPENSERRSASSLTVPSR
jgi:phospholipid-binding lipoprotein MlaA